MTKVSTICTAKHPPKTAMRTDACADCNSWCLRKDGIHTGEAMRELLLQIVFNLYRLHARHPPRAGLPGAAPQSGAGGGLGYHFQLSRLRHYLHGQ